MRASCVALAGPSWRAARISNPEAVGDTSARHFLNTPTALFEARLNRHAAPHRFDHLSLGFDSAVQRRLRLRPSCRLPNLERSAIS
jgi:hypothetical protein